MDRLAAALGARDEQDWQSCHDAASHATGLVGRAEADRLDLVAESSWWLGRLDDCIAARQAAYLAYEKAGDRRRAGQCAVWLYEHHCFGARPSVAGAWLARARRALEGEGGVPCIELGALLLREAELAHGRGGLDEAAELAGRGIELGRELRCADLESEALQALGRIRIDQGRPAEGLSLLDEAMLFVVEGRLSPYSTGKVYCSLISACEQLSDHRRAAEWTTETARWAERHPLAVFPGLCRVHHATALQWQGDWAGAEREAARASKELTGINLPNAAAAWAEIGDIRRRLGDVDGAAVAFAEADALCASARPGLAMLRLAEGDLGAASSIVAEALEAAGWNRLARAKVLPALAQIAIAAGDVATAASAVEELGCIAADFDSEGLRAVAASARGRLLLASPGGDGAALVTLRSAVAQWNDLGVPYEIATARMLLGEALRRAGDERAAASAFAAARDLFDGLGIAADAVPTTVRTADPSGGGSSPLPRGLTEREAEVLRLVAAGHTNREVAAALYLSEKTVARHLSNIFTKIGVSTRSAATAFAFGNGIVG